MVYYQDRPPVRQNRYIRTRRAKIHAVSFSITALFFSFFAFNHNIFTAQTHADTKINRSVFISAQEFCAEHAQEETDKQEVVEASVTKDISSPVFTNLSKPLKKGRITSPYGYRTNPVTGKYSKHCGLDIGAKEGAEIHAVMSGTVKKSGKESSYGNYLIIDHGNGYRTLYAHCSKLLKKTGEKVEAGEAIALVGHTGRATGPHLHIEVRKNGEKIDPLPFLEGMYK